MPHPPIVDCIANLQEKGRTGEGIAGLTGDAPAHILALVRGGVNNPTATNLQAAFDKFIELRLAKGEMTETVRSQIVTWKQEIDEVVRMLAEANKKSQKELLEADALRLKATLKKEGIM